jgi:hypothetical protein
MSRIEVDGRELRRAADTHWQAREKITNNVGLARARCLLAFYAVECAMKAYFLSCKKWHSTRLLCAEFGENGHDLRCGMKACKVPATCGHPPDVCREGGAQIPTHKVHEAWRYGAKLGSADERAFEQWLAGIFQWLDGVRS